MMVTPSRRVPLKENKTRISRRFYFLIAACIVVIIYLGLINMPGQTWSDKIPIGHILQSLRLPFIKRQYQILIWKSASFYKLVYYGHGSDYHDPLDQCPVNNCLFTNDTDALLSSDAIIFHIREVYYKELPEFRWPYQRWIFTIMESPYHTFSYHSEDWGLGNYDNLFNWTMTYRSDSDIFVPYGRIVPLTEVEKNRTKNEIIDYSKSKRKLVMWVSSNCKLIKNDRIDFVRQLARHIPIDRFGQCGTRKCKGRYLQTCEDVKYYKFYLALENSNCREYITEKFWVNALANDVVPIVLGARKADYERLAPPFSYIYAEDFRSMKELAKYLQYLHRNSTAYNRYFEWKKHYRIENLYWCCGGHSHHLCRLCQALNNDDGKSKSYQISAWWNEKRDCYGSSWKRTMVPKY